MRTLPFAALLTVDVLLVYGPGLHAPLVFDDHDAITANPTIRTLSTALSPPPQTPVAGRPLPNLSFALPGAQGARAECAPSTGATLRVRVPPIRLLGHARDGAPRAADCPGRG